MILKSQKPSFVPPPLRKERVQANETQVGDHIMLWDGAYSKIIRLVPKRDDIEIFTEDGKSRTLAKNVLVGIQRAR